MIQNPAVHPPDQPFAPFDFLFTKEHIERAILIDKKVIDTSLFAGGGPGGGAPKAWTQRSYILVLQIASETFEIEVSKQAHDLWHIGDAVVVKVQQGRWTGKLKGKICQR